MQFDAQADFLTYLALGYGTFFIIALLLLLDYLTNIIIIVSQVIMY